MIEIVNIEKTAYDKFVGQFEGFVKKMTEMGNRGTNKCLGDWLDNDEVCRNLKISKTVSGSSENQQENLADFTGQWYAGIFADKPQNLLQARGCAERY